MLFWAGAFTVTNKLRSRWPRSEPLVEQARGKRPGGGAGLLQIGSVARAARTALALVAVPRSALADSCRVSWPGSLQRWHSPPHHPHGLAAGATPVRTFGRGPRWLARRGPQVQHRLQHQPQTVCTGQCALGWLAGLGVAELEADLALVVAAQDVGLLDHAAVQGVAPVQQRLLAVAYRLAVDHPDGRQAGRQRQAGGEGGVQQHPAPSASPSPSARLGTTLAAKFSLHSSALTKSLSNAPARRRRRSALR